MSSMQGCSISLPQAEEGREWLHLRRAVAGHGALPWGGFKALERRGQAVFDALEALGDALLAGLEESLPLPAGHLRAAAPTMADRRRYAAGSNPLSDSYMRLFHCRPPHALRWGALESSHPRLPTLHSSQHAPLSWCVLADPPGFDEEHRMHVDVGLLTVAPLALTQGLQVLQCTSSDDHRAGAGAGAGDGDDSDLGSWRWVDLEPPAAPGTIAVFGGEVLSLLSGGAVPALFHRIARPDAERPRVSMPFFQRPPREHVLSVPPGAGGGAPSKPMRMDEYWNRVLKRQPYNL